MFLGLAPIGFLLLLIVIIAVIVAAARRQGDEEEESGIGTLKRVFYYLLGFIALGVTATGLSLLLSTLIEPLFDKAVIVTGEHRLALALALTLVGTPIWLYLWQRAQRATQEFPAEARSLGRLFYLYLILGIAAAAGATSLVTVLRWAFGANDDPSLALAILLVMTGIWLFHWRAADPVANPSRGVAALMPRLYIYLTALYALVMFAAGTGLVLYRFLLEAYEAIAQTPILDTEATRLWSRGMRESLSIAMVGGLWWWAHWFWMGRRDIQPGLRQVYLYIFAVFGGAVTVVVAAAFLIHGILVWVVDAPGLDTAGEHFRFLAVVISGLVVGSALWGYHYAVIREEAQGAEGRFIGARRGYQYLVAAVGLATLAVGLVIAFGVGIGVLLPHDSSLLTTDDWKRPLTLAITLVTVGTPLWWYYWSQVQHEATAAPIEERTRTSRRVFIYAVFGIALLLTLGNLSALLFVVLRDLLEGKLTLESVHESRWFMGSLLMAGAISIYYGFVLREDRRVLAGAAPAVTAVSSAARKRVIAISSAEGRDAVRRVEAALGYPVTWWQALDSAPGLPALADSDLVPLPDRIALAPGTRVLLLIDSNGVRVLPYQTE